MIKPVISPRITCLKNTHRRVRETDANFNETLYEYHWDGQVTQITDTLGGVTRYEYDLLGRRTAAINAIGAKTAYEYSQMGYLTKETNPYGQETIYEREENGNVHMSVRLSCNTRVACI